MNYQLALQLKEAGFPQTTEFFHEEFEDADNQRYHRPHYIYGIRKGEAPSVEQGLIADPTLSELIEACGEKIAFRLQFVAHKWLAENCGKLGIGSTPEEAVANLWLALNSGVGGKDFRG